LLWLHRKNVQTVNFAVLGEQAGLEIAALAVDVKDLMSILQEQAADLSADAGVPPVMT